jgi:hypothetical protein
MIGVVDRVELCSRHHGPQVRIHVRRRDELVQRAPDDARRMVVLARQSKHVRPVTEQVHVLHDFAQHGREIL